MLRNQHRRSNEETARVHDTCSKIFGPPETCGDAQGSSLRTNVVPTHRTRMYKDVKKDMVCFLISLENNPNWTRNGFL